MGEKEGWDFGKWLKLIRHEKTLYTGAREARQNFVKYAKQAVWRPSDSQRARRGKSNNAAHGPVSQQSSHL